MPSCADRQPGGRLQYQVRLLQMHLCNNEKRRWGLNVTENGDRGLKRWRSMWSCRVTLLLVHCEIFVGLSNGNVRLTAWDRITQHPGWIISPIRHHPQGGHAVICFQANLHPKVSLRGASCIRNTLWCNCVSRCGPRSIILTGFLSPASHRLGCRAGRR